MASQRLFIDYKASRVGDIVTIVISENVKSTYEKKADSAKKSSVLSTVTNLLFPAAAPPASTDTLNANKKYTGSRAGMHNGKLPSSQWDATQDFQGDGTIDNQSKVEARISARVVALLPNDHLLVEGKRSVGVGEEVETIVVSGIVRQEDIRPDNTIESQYIADARINIEGKGPITTSTKKGFLTKMWEFLGIY